jgi:hypothetical protein
MAHWHAYSLRLRAADLDPVEPLEAAAPPPVTSLLQVRAASKKLLPPGIRHLQVLPAKLEQLQRAAVCERARWPGGTVSSPPPSVLCYRLPTGER